MRGNESTTPSRLRRTALGLAGLAIALGGVAATAGPAGAAPGIDIQNPDGVPFADRLVMNRTQGGDDGLTVKDVAIARIVNGGDQPLHVTALTVTGPFELVAPAALPATVPTGGVLEVPVRFVAQEEGPNGGRHDGALTITSDAANAPSRVVELSGFWQIAVGGSNEGTLAEILSTFGYATTIVGPGQKLQNKSTVEAVGDEVLAPLWRRADLTKPVGVRQLGGFHGKTEGVDTFAWYPKDSPASAEVILTQALSDYQTLLPRADDLGPGAAAFTPSPATPVFGFRLAGQWSEPALNPRPASCVGECGHMVRFWPLLDRAGVPMAGQYLATMDFANATSGNYDYQDNFYLVSNVVPADAVTDTIAPTVASRQPAPGAAAVAVDTNVTAAFSEPMHPGSLTPASVTLTRSGGGAPVAGTVTTSLDGTQVTLDPSADLTPGTGYTAMVTTAAVDAAGNPLAAAESWSFTTAGPTDPGPGQGGPGPKDTGVTPGPGAKDPARGATTAACARYPQLRRTLARQLAAAKKLRARAATPKARAAAVRRIARIARQQRQASARLTAACGASAAYCLRYPDLSSGIARQLAAARKARAAATTRAARAAAAKRLAAASRRQKQAAARYTACATAEADGDRGAGQAQPPGNRLPAGTSGTAPKTSLPPKPPPPLPTPTDVGLTTKLRVATGAMLGEAGNPRWLYLSESVGPWRPTYAGGHPLARGKLMNFRAINAIYDDENKAQLIPGFDPEANTDEFIRWLPTYRSLGILGFTLGLQGGKPNYEGNIASAFRPDGSMKQEWLDRAERVIRAADAQGMVVILSYFYKVQEREMEGDEAIRRAAREATDWVIAEGFGNVILELANEYNTSGYKHPILTSGKAEATFPGVAELITLVKSRFEGKGYRLPVGASHTRLEVPGSIRAVADVSLVHGNPFRPAEDGALVAGLVNDSTVPGPVIVNEDFNGYGTSEANIQGERQSASNVFLAGGSWGHMWQPYNQAYPFQWAVGESEDVSQGDEANRFRAVLNHVAHLVAPDGVPPSFAEELPAPGSADVSTSTSIVAGFSEPMDPASLASGSLVLSRGGVPVPATTGLAPSGDIVTLTPTAPLDPHTLYTVTLTGGATDTAGNPLTGGTSWSFTTGAAPAPGAGPALGQGGELTLEAEAYSWKVARGGYDWLAGQSPSGAVGGALFAGPDGGQTVANNARANAAELRFDVRFDRPGVYRLWLRGHSPHAGSNSVSLSLDGQDPDAGDAGNLISNELGGWGWFTTRNGAPVGALSVPTAGQHTVHVYMREDGFHLDRILLSNAPPNSASQFFVPIDAGPPASPRA